MTTTTSPGTELGRPGRRPAHFHHTRGMGIANALAARLAEELLGHPMESNLLRAGGRSRPRSA